MPEENKCVFPTYWLKKNKWIYEFRNTNPQELECWSAFCVNHFLRYYLMMQHQPIVKRVNGTNEWAHMSYQLLSAPYHCCLYKHRRQDERQPLQSSWPVPICTQAKLTSGYPFHAVGNVMSKNIRNIRNMIYFEQCSIKTGMAQRDPLFLLSPFPVLTGLSWNQTPISLLKCVSPKWKQTLDRINLHAVRLCLPLIWIPQPSSPNLNWGKILPTTNEKKFQWTHHVCTMLLHYVLS